MILKIHDLGGISHYNIKKTYGVNEGPAVGMVLTEPAWFFAQQTYDQILIQKWKPKDFILQKIW